MKPLTYDEAAHLLRRMGFSGPPDEINDLVARGRENAVDLLLNYDSVDNSSLDKALRRDKRFFEKINDPDYPFELRARVCVGQAVCSVRDWWEAVIFQLFHPHAELGERLLGIASER